MTQLAEIRAVLDGHRIVRAVDRLPAGTFRLETVFRYPDGAYMDLFLVESSSLDTPTFRAQRLSDLAATTEWLLDVQVKPWLSPKRKALLEDSIRMYGVTQEGGALEIELDSLDELVDKVVTLGQACLRVADLTFTRRTSLQAPIVQEVEEVLVDLEIPYETNYELHGRFAPVRVDILATTSRASSAILTLSSTNTSTSHVAANEIFRKWFDLNIPERDEQRLTVYDDRKGAYRDEDLERLGTVSTVLPLSDRQTLADFVSA